MLAEALRCKLCGQIMVDPVIVVSTDSDELTVGDSYERAALEAWKGEHPGARLSFVANPALQAMTVVYNRLAVSARMSVASK